MVVKTAKRRLEDWKPLPLIEDGLPIVYEDDNEEEMGETNYHTDSTSILYNGMILHFAQRTSYRIFSNLNVYYSPTKRKAYVSPDAMVMIPKKQLGKYVDSYRIGMDGPAPLLTAEILSKRSYQQGDLKKKLKIYALIGVREYLLVDVTGRFLPERLLLKRLGPDRRWQDFQDADGGVTSELGFRVIVDDDDRLRVMNAETRESYLRPEEAEDERLAREAEAAARRKAEIRAEKAEQRARELEEKMARMSQIGKRNGKKRPKE